MRVAAEKMAWSRNLLYEDNEVKKKKIMLPQVRLEIVRESLEGRPRRRKQKQYVTKSKRVDHSQCKFIMEGR